MNDHYEKEQFMNIYDP